ncbi:MAG TPA: hypothetical protein VFN87_01000 [Solirubrobacteraceae bacterium]|nr:hypothetical protein [Solirubrobacteraceae bacterium]
MGVPTAALANSTCQQYSAKDCSASTLSTQLSKTSTVSSTSASTLPFTGLDVGLLVVGGSVLLGAGLLVRRFSRQPE